VWCSSKNHQRALESMQASLEAEARGKADFVRTKKKLEQDINELEIALDAANRGRAEAEKNVKKFQQQIVEILQVCNDQRNLRDKKSVLSLVILPAFHHTLSLLFADICNMHVTMCFTMH